ncbi:MAG: hypothetical protein RI885_1308, partial [Actinomycetota bacterium]
LRWSDIPGDRILQFDPATGGTTVHREPVEFTNGRTLDLDGAVIQCSHGRRAVEREVDGVLTTLCDSYRGVRLNSPNDVVVDSRGAIWFTDPPYGIVQAAEGHPGEREYGDHFVFRLGRGETEPVPVVLDVEEPNGLAFSPDESILYVADTSAALRSDGSGNRHVRAYDVIGGRRCKNGRTVISLDPVDGLIDGLRVDTDGRLWCSSATAVLVYSPEGAELLRIPVPEVIANLCFGGDDGTDLYITATTSLYRIATVVMDAARRVSAP